jgi:hypothetical protein
MCFSVACCLLRSIRLFQIAIAGKLTHHALVFMKVARTRSVFLQNIGEAVGLRKCCLPVLTWNSIPGPIVRLDFKYKGDSLHAQQPRACSYRP